MTRMDLIPELKKVAHRQTTHITGRVYRLAIPKQNINHPSLHLWLDCIEQYVTCHNSKPLEITESQSTDCTCS